MKFKWEQIGTNGNDGAGTYRAKVPGGWIVRDICLGKIYESKEKEKLTSVSLTESMVFIPDPNHEWSIEE